MDKKRKDFIEAYIQMMESKGKVDTQLNALRKNLESGLKDDMSQSTFFPQWEVEGESGTVGVHEQVRAPSEKIAKEYLREQMEKEGHKNPKITAKMNKSQAKDVADKLLFVEDILELDSEALTEVLDVQARRKRGQTMKRYSKKIAMARKRKMARMASKEQITTRARRAAIAKVRERFAGAMGKNYNTLSPSQKMQVDQRVATKKAMVAKIAKKLLPQVKRKEMERMKNKGKKS